MVMKTLLTVGLLLIGLSGQALSMGHPHNVFAARKHLRAKSAMSVVQSKTPVRLSWQPTVQVDKNAFSKRLLTALSRVRPVQSY